MLENYELDEFRDPDIKYFYGWGGGKKPWSFAKFFSPKASFEIENKIEYINVYTKCQIEEAVFNLKIYEVKQNGEPDVNLFKNIQAQAQFGEHWTCINVSESEIKLPKKGLFISVNRIEIESNKVEFNCHKSNSKIRIISFDYEPGIGTVPKSDNAKSWIFKNDEWKKVSKNKLTILSNYAGMYIEPAIELVFES